MNASEPRDLVEHFFRHESGRLVALLTRSLGVARLDLIEEVVQGALTQALQAWPRRGIPDDPGAWLYRAARNLAVDHLRRDRTFQNLLPRVVEVAESRGDFDAEEIGDEPLRLLFLCCHESVPIASRVALALRTLCGFSTAEIARGLLTSEANVQKRIARAKERLRDEPGAWEAPGLEHLRARTDSVLAVIYLLFNEGYQASQADEAIRRDLCDEAIRLGRMLANHPLGDTPPAFAVLSLMCFHAARFNARTNADGCALLLHEQDRSTWDWSLVREGMNWMARSATGDDLTRYHLEAAIAWEHCRAQAFEATDWRRIAQFYEILQSRAPSPLHILNLAVAESYRDGPDAGLRRLDSVEPADRPTRYPIWPAVVGELRYRTGDFAGAEAAWIEALAMHPARADEDLIRKRLAECRTRKAEAR